MPSGASDEGGGGRGGSNAVGVLPAAAFLSLADAAKGRHAAKYIKERTFTERKTTTSILTSSNAPPATAAGGGDDGWNTVGPGGKAKQPAPAAAQAKDGTRKGKVKKALIQGEKFGFIAPVDGSKNVIVYPRGLAAGTAYVWPRCPTKANCVAHNLLDNLRTIIIYISSQAPQTAFRNIYI